MSKAPKIICSALNINDVPKVAAMMKIVREDTHSKPRARISANDIDLDMRIRKILTERFKKNSLIL